MKAMTDYRHKSGFKLQGLILQQLICAVENGQIIQGPINKEDGTPHQYSNNKEFVINLLIQCIKEMFPNLNNVQIEAFVWKLFNNCNDWSEFKSTLRDLLISMKSFSSNNDEFYEEERKVSTTKLIFLGCPRGVKEARPNAQTSHSRNDQGW